MCAFRDSFSGDKISINTAEQIFKDISKLKIISRYYNFTSIRLDGNSEPLLYDKLPEIISLANKYGIKDTNITTNGLLLTKDRCKGLLVAGLKTIDISMTGIIPEVYKNFQGANLSSLNCKKNIETIKLNVKNLVELKKKIKAKTRVTVRYIVTKENAYHLQEWINFFREIGVDSVLLMTLTDTKLRQESKPKGKVIGYKVCDSINHPVIKANGDVLLAFCPFQIPTLGNLYNKSLIDILTSRKTEQINAAFKQLNVKNLPPNCLKCFGTHIYEK